MKTIRGFLAVKLDLETVRNLAEVQKRLKERCKESGTKVAWVPPPNIHVTIRFLGQITEPMAYAIKDMLQPIASYSNAFELETAGLGVFPDLQRPRVVWAGLKAGTEELKGLYNTVSERLTGAGFQLDDRPFKSHVTLGRVKGGRVDALGSCLGDDDEFWGTTMVRSLYCYRSDLNPKGAEYHALWRLSFIDSRRGERRQYANEMSRKEDTEGSKSE